MAQTSPKLIKIPRLFTHFYHHAYEHKDIKSFPDFLQNITPSITKPTHIQKAMMMGGQRLPVAILSIAEAVV